MNMKLSFRWYGESDPISLEYISQIPGMRSIVSAVYDVKPGEVWPEESLARMKAACEAHGLIFDIVESIPVHEDIKLGRNNVPPFPGCRFCGLLHESHYAEKWSYSGPAYAAPALSASSGDRKIGNECCQSSGK